MSEKLHVEPQNCTGCKSCMLICSFAHTDAFSYEDSRIRVEKNEYRGESTPVVCRNCDEAPCIDACPVEAVQRDPVTARVALNEEECTGCGDCVDACPYQAICLNRSTGIAVKCDFCSGDPQCIQVCRFPEALTWR